MAKSPRKELMFQDVLEAYAQRRGVSPREALRQAEEPPRWLALAERHARARGQSLQEFLEEDARRLRESPYPGPDCLQPFEVERYVREGVLPEGRLEHLRDCAMCAEVVQYAEPSDGLGGQDGSFVDEVEALAQATLAREAGVPLTVESSGSAGARQPISTVSLLDLVLIHLDLATACFRSFGRPEAFALMDILRRRLESIFVGQPDRVAQAQRAVCVDVAGYLRHSLQRAERPSRDFVRVGTAALDVLDIEAPDLADDLRPAFEDRCALVK